MKNSPIRMLLGIWLLALLVPLASGQSPVVNDGLNRLESALQAALDEVVETEYFPGATLAVALPNGKLLSLASGFSDPDSKIKMKIGDSMLVGSTGKTFVSAVALQLISEGAFQLDDPVIKFFADRDQAWFSRLPNSGSLTVRSLMNHTSGLPRYVFSEKFLKEVRESPMKPHTPRESIGMILDSEPIHEVGNGWGYSDTNYLLLGLIIEKTTGNSFYDESKRRLLAPHHLDHTLPSTQAKLPSLVQGHIGKSNPFGLPAKTVKDGHYAINPGFEWCGGGYVSNVEDLAQWMRVLHQGEILKKEMYDQLVDAVGFRTGKPENQGYGLGTFVWQSSEGKFLGHAGMMPGYLTQIEFSRRHQFSIAFQVNTDEGFGRKNHRFVQQFSKLVSDYLALKKKALSDDSF